MNPFTQMAAVLNTAHQPAWAKAEPIPAGLSRTERIRRLVKEAAYPITALEIAWDMGEHFHNFSTSLVWLLLKYDIQKGRVILEDGKYRWNHDYDTAESQSVRAAIKLLRAHGYRVTGGST